MKKIIKLEADWCVPCKRFAPVIKRVCDEMNIELISLDVEKDHEKILEYGLSAMSLPTIFFMRDNKVISHKFGTMSEYEIKHEIDKL